MAKRRWVTVDTRNHVREGKCLFDGFVHRVPRSKFPLHEVTMHCWCDPELFWMPEAGTVLVAHEEHEKDDDE